MLRETTKRALGPLLARTLGAAAETGARAMSTRNSTDIREIIAGKIPLEQASAEGSPTPAAWGVFCCDAGRRATCGRRTADL